MFARMPPTAIYVNPVIRHSDSSEFIKLHKIEKKNREKKRMKGIKGSHFKGTPGYTHFFKCLHFLW